MLLLHKHYKHTRNSSGDEIAKRDFLHILASLYVRHWDNRGKCYMDGNRIQCWSNAWQHIPIYLQPFTSYSDILVGNCNFFLPLAFNAPVGVIPLDDLRDFWWVSCRMTRLQYNTIIPNMYEMRNHCTKYRLKPGFHYPSRRPEYNGPS